jgi:hypothetical protein
VGLGDQIEQLSKIAKFQAWNFATQQNTAKLQAIDIFFYNCCQHGPGEWFRTSGVDRRRTFHWWNFLWVAAQSQAAAKSQVGVAHPHTTKYWESMGNFRSIGQIEFRSSIVPILDQQFADPAKLCWLHWGYQGPAGTGFGPGFLQNRT